MAAHDDDDFFDDPRRRHKHNTDLDNPVFKQLDQLTRNKRGSQSSTSSSSRRSSTSLAKPPSRRTASSPSGSESETTIRASSSDSDLDSKEASVQIFPDKSKSSASDRNTSTSSSNGRIVQATVPSVPMQSDSDSDQSDSDTYTDGSSSHDGEKNKKLNDFNLKAEVRNGSSKSASLANRNKSSKSSSAELEHQESMDHLSINDSVSDGSYRVEATSAKHKRIKSASKKRGQSKSMPSGSTEERLANNKQLLKEVLDIDSQYRCYSRPSSASSTSSQSRLQRPRSGAVEIPYRWRRNYTFTDDRVWQIEQENQRLLKNIRTTNAEISRCNSSKGTVGFDKRAAGEIIRTKKLQELEAKNLAMLRRIQSIQPSPDVDRDVLLNEYRRQQIAYHGGPSRLIWATHSKH